jgi:hypothetical protein
MITLLKVVILICSTFIFWWTVLNQDPYWSLKIKKYKFHLYYLAFLLILSICLWIKLKNMP